MILAAQAAILAEGAEAHREFQYPVWAYGAGALVVFLILLFIVTRFDPDR